jgi:hypothetical protein
LRSRFISIVAEVIERERDDLCPYLAKLLSLGEVMFRTLHLFRKDIYDTMNAWYEKMPSDQSAH